MLQLVKTSSASIKLNYSGFSFDMSELRRLATHANTDSIFYYENMFLEHYPEIQDEMLEAVAKKPRNIKESKALVTKASRIVAKYHSRIVEVIWDEVDIPSIIKEVYTPSLNHGTDGTREETFTADEYRELAVLSTMLKLMFPAILVSMAKLVMLTESVDMVLLIYRALRKQMPDSTIGKLKRFSDAVSAKTESKGKRSSRTLVLDVTDTDLDDFAMANLVLHRLSLARYKGNVNAVVIRNLRSKIAEINQAGTTGNKRVLEYQPLDGSDDKPEVTVLDYAQVASTVSIDRKIETEVYLNQSAEKLASDIGVTLTPLYETALNSFKAYEQIEPHYLSEYIVGLIVSDCVDPRYLRYVDIACLPKIYALSYLWLIENGLGTLSRVIGLLVSQSGDRFTGLNASIIGRDDELEILKPLNGQIYTKELTRTLATDSFTNKMDVDSLVLLRESKKSGFTESSLKAVRNELLTLMVRIEQRIDNGI